MNTRTIDRSTLIEASKRAQRFSKEKQTTRHVIYESGEFFVASDAAADDEGYTPSQFRATYYCGTLQVND